MKNKQNVTFATQRSDERIYLNEHSFVAFYQYDRERHLLFITFRKTRAQYAYEISLDDLKQLASDRSIAMIMKTIVQTRAGEFIQTIPESQMTNNQRRARPGRSENNGWNNFLAQ